MPRFEVEFTVSATVTAIIEAETIKAAQTQLEKLDCVDADFTFLNSPFVDDPTGAMYDVELGCICEADDEDAA